MKARAALLGIATLAIVLAGCLGPAAPPEGLQPNDEPEPEPLPDPPPRSPPPASPPPRAAPPPAAPPSPEPPPDHGPQVVIAHIDTGINPYHRAFRDFSALAQLHPSTYLPGFPANATALRLTFTAPTYAEALERDRDLWAGVQEGQLYWFPGTRIVGAIRFGSGGVLCPQPTVAQPTVPGVPVPAVPGVPQEVQCVERPLLDDHGHGTMTASRMAGGEHSLCPACRIVTIEGLGGAGVRWAAEQGWIDVQTNSWGSLVPATVPEVNSATRQAFTFAASRMLVFAASGNGLGFEGFVGEPTVQQATASAGVFQVGAHDNGRATLYHGQPPHVVADGYGGWRANARDLEEWSPSPEACCTSASSPYAAGAAAAALLEARRLTGHRATGWPDGVGAKGTATAGAALQDGQLTLAEAQRVLLLAATPRPQEHPDDGMMHWTGALPDGKPVDPTQPGENPYCTGCWTLPARWRDIPAEGPTFTVLGYGALDALAVDYAGRILRGEAQTPAREAEDQFFALDATARGVFDALP